MPSPSTLSWPALSKLSPADVDSAILVGDRDDTRRVALSALAAPVARRAPHTLWIGAQDVLRPLPWLPLIEQRLDARPLRPAYGDVPWPAIHPLALSPEQLVGWLALRLDVDGADDRGRLADAAGVLAARRADPVSHGRVSEALHEGWDVLEAALPDALGPSVRSLADRHSPTGRALTFTDHDLTVICGHRTDLTTRHEAIVLAVLAFVSAWTARSRAESPLAHPPLVVLEDVADGMSEGERALIADALTDLLAADGRVLVATARPEAWGEDVATRDLWSRSAVLWSSSAAVPTWMDAPSRPAGQPGAATAHDGRPLAALDTSSSSPTWTCLSVRSPLVSA